VSWLLQAVTLSAPETERSLANSVMNMWKLTSTFIAWCEGQAQLIDGVLDCSEVYVGQRCPSIAVTSKKHADTHTRINWAHKQ